MIECDAVILMHAAIHAARRCPGRPAARRSSVCAQEALDRLEARALLRSVPASDDDTEILFDDEIEFLEV